MTLIRLYTLVLSVGFAATMPASGGDAPQGGSLELFDQAMRTFMTERHIGAGALAVSRDGKLLLSRAYGFADEEHHRAVRADDPFRLASVSKPFTAAVVRHLIAEGKLSPDTRVFPLLAVEPFPGHTPDPRLEQITVDDLLQHKGGWDREASFDPMFRPIEIARVARMPPPANHREIIRYMIGMPLQFDPASKSVYSNFGYCVLGRVIEKVTGKKYADALKEMILDPLDIHTVELGRTLPRLRNPREPIYVDPGRERDVMEPRSDKPVPAPDGGFPCTMGFQPVRIALEHQEPRTSILQ